MSKGTGNVMVFPDPKRAEEKHLLQLARKLSATIGSEFFTAMAKHLTQELSADCIYIGEFTSGQAERIRPLASFLDGEPYNSSFPLAGSAAAGVLREKGYFCRMNAQKRYPADELLAKVNARAFVTVPLSDFAGTPLGFMMAIYRHSAAHLHLARTMLEIFAPRAAAELVRKQRDEQLRESEQRYKAFIAANADAMWRIEFEQPIPTSLPEEEQFDRIYQYGYLAECNDALARLLGADKPERLIGCNVDVLAPRSNASVREATLRAIRCGYRFTTVETTPLGQNGKHRYMLRSQCGIVDDGLLLRLWGITRDISELKHSELELDASERRLADLLEAVHLAVITLEPGGAIVSCNDYFERLTGWKPADIRGQNWLELMIPAEESNRLRTAFADARAGSQIPLHFESTLRGPGGQRWWIAWDATILRNAVGQAAATVIVGRDITEQRVLESQFRQAQKLESVGRLASGIAHDFNNLLTVIRGYAELLLQKTDEADPVHTGLLEIQKSAERGAQLTHQLLAFSRRQTLRPETLNLNVLIADSERMLLRLIGADVRLKTQPDPTLGLVRADAGQIHQVLLNLAVNARDAMPNGGELTITSSNVAVTENGPFAVPPGEYVQLAIADTGLGMNEEVKSHLFEPFFTTKEPGKGTGLGLSAAYGIIRQSGGHIVVETELNKGTCIRIFLPRIEEEAKTAPVESADSELRGGTETILVVDDQQDVRLVTGGIIRDLGYVVLEAESPAQAMEIARNNPHIDLLLTDMVMPEMGGPKLADAIRETHSRIKVVFMSGYLDLPRKGHGGDSKIGPLQKPFDATALSTIMRTVLDSK